MPLREGGGPYARDQHPAPGRDLDIDLCLAKDVAAVAALRRDVAANAD
jgi:hypothetical protein